MDILNGIAINEDNYYIIYQKLKPKIERFIYLMKGRYTNLDLADIESTTLEAMLNTIHLYDSTKGASFSTYFFLHASCEVKNLYIATQSKNKLAKIVPLDKVLQNEENEKGEETVASTYEEDQILERLVETDIISKLKNLKPKHAIFIQKLLEGYSVKEIAEEEQVQVQTIYFRQQRLMKALNRILKNSSRRELKSVENRSRNLYNSCATEKGKEVKVEIETENEKGGKAMELICKVCGKKKQATKSRIEKLVAKMGSLEKVKAEYVCLKCRQKVEKVAKKAVKAPKAAKETVQETVVASPKTAEVTEVVE